VDVEQLRAAYERFFEFAEHGGFKQPAAGEWSAAEIVAHVAFNDVLLADLTETLLVGGDPTSDDEYDNSSVADADALDRLVAGRSYAELLLLARENAARLVDAAARLDEHAAARLVPSRIIHAGQPVLDEAVPWGDLLRRQAQRHLPHHTEQLEALCV